MTVQEMQIVFTQKLLNEYNIVDPIQTFDIEYYLTEAQRRVYEKYYRLFEVDEKARKILSNLVVSVDIPRATGVYISQTGKYPNGEFWELPSDLAYTLKEEATININACEDVTSTSVDWLRVYTKPINLDYYNRNINNPFKKPYSGMVWRVDVSNIEGTKLHMLVTGGNYSVQTYHLTYLSYPTNISINSSVNSVLAEMVHQDIVDEAVNIALEIIQVNNKFKTTQ